MMEKTYVHVQCMWLDRREVGALLLAPGAAQGEKKRKKHMHNA